MSWGFTTILFPGTNSRFDRDCCVRVMIGCQHGSRYYVGVTYTIAALVRSLPLRPLLCNGGKIDFVYLIATMPGRHSDYNGTA